MRRWALVPLTLACSAIAVPLLLMRAPQLGLALQCGFALVCHQQAERSFVLFGGSVAVCTRCLGIYLGAAAGVLVRVSRRVAWRWLVAAVAINVIDWPAEFAGLHGNWMFVRCIFGFALGAAAALLVASYEVISPTQAKEA